MDPTGCRYCSDMQVVLFKRGAPLVLALTMLTIAGCSAPTAPSTTLTVSAPPTKTVAAKPPARVAIIPVDAQPPLASDPAQLADDLVADENSAARSRRPRTHWRRPHAASRRPTAPSGTTRNGMR
jgi:hypothetical protein